MLTSFITNQTVAPIPIALAVIIPERARVAEIFATSVEGGMRTLKIDGM